MTAHIIKVSLTEAIKVEPDGEKVKLSALLMGVPVGSRSVDLGTVGAVLFALEQAAEVAEGAKARREAGQGA